jgi:tetratricopeptide (TPR) repeat protein
MPRIRAVRVVLSLVPFLLAATATLPQSAQKPTVALTGSIFSDGTNQRIARASIALCDAGGIVLQESAADDGEFSFQGLQPARYILKVQATGFDSAELHIELSFTSQRGLSVMLKPTRISQPPVSQGQTISAHELAMAESSRDLLASGKKKLYTEKNAEAALKDFQTSLQKSPQFYEAHYQAGMAYLFLQSPDEAEKEFRKSVDLSQKQYPDADVALGTVLLERGETKEGETLLREGLALNPRSWQGQYALGKMELTRGHEDVALAAAQQAAALAPNQPVVYRLLAVIHLRQKNYAALLADLDAYLQLDPDGPAGLRAKELRAQVEEQAGAASGPTVSAKK